MESKYDKFRWLKKWVDYSSSLNDNQKLALSQSIARYGLNDEEPQGLDEAVLGYFNEAIRPELDRQHQAKSSKNNRKQPKTSRV